MRVEIKNLGPLVHAEFELGDWTIICGNNNTGKTYATYALFGFLSFWKDVFTINVTTAEVNHLFDSGVLNINLLKYIEQIPDILLLACQQYQAQFPIVFAGSPEKFRKTEFSIEIPQKHIQLMDKYTSTISSTNNTKHFSFIKNENSSDLVITLLTTENEIQVSKQVAGKLIGDAIKTIIFSHNFPDTFIASAERTGVAIFRRELNLGRNHFLHELGLTELSPLTTASMVKTLHDYPLPVSVNIEFIKDLESISKKSSFIAEEYPAILDDFADIIGGEYRVTREGLYYIPKAKKSLRLTMDESSSAVRSLLDIGFYLRHVAKPGDLLMIDEPELNLHPANQRRIARLLARLTHVGIKVFITTHSDYIIKELNTLIMLNQDKPHLKRIQEQEGYITDELMAYDKVKVYIAEKDPKKNQFTLTPAEITPESGINARSFDPTIEDMNRIQDEIIWGDD